MTNRLNSAAVFFSIYCWGNMQMLPWLAMNPFLSAMELSKEKMRSYRKRNEAV